MDTGPFAYPVLFRVTPRARQMAALIARDEPDGVWRCRYCRVEVSQLDVPPDVPPEVRGTPHAERDHVVPRSRGGAGDMSNSVVACQGCNVRKGDRLLSELPRDWAEWRSLGRSV
jgi:5-methylcytosine-specific restriction endonuclease McrA